uniref:Uncharacterized protein n=1 Tax=Opuntia streptacantha TaxID=393608 RepID=A0A7C8YDZ3_OPUST
MNSLAPSKLTSSNHFHPPFHSNRTQLHSKSSILQFHSPKLTNQFSHVRKLPVRAHNNTNEGAEEEENGTTQKRSFLSLEEAGLVELSGLNTHERFLCRLTISSLNLLRVIAEQEGCSIEELNAGRICDWFLKDKLKRVQNIGSAVLQWEDDDPYDLQS